MQNVHNHYAFITVLHTIVTSIALLSAIFPFTELGDTPRISADFADVQRGKSFVGGAVGGQKTSNTTSNILSNTKCRLPPNYLVFRVYTPVTRPFGRVASHKRSERKIVMISSVIPIAVIGLVCIMLLAALYWHWRVYSLYKSLDEVKRKFIYSEFSFQFQNPWLGLQ